MRFTLFFCLLPLSIFGQDQGVVTNGEVSAATFISSEDNLPFWFYTNQHNQIGATSDFQLSASVASYYNINENHRIGAGVSGVYRNGVMDEFQRINLFANYTNRWIEVTLGSKEEEIQLEGLSATNQNFLWSGNARPLPGVKLEAPGWVRIVNGVYLDWGIGHFVLNDDRFVDDAWVHFKDLGVKWEIDTSNTIKFKIQHVAQWAGNSPLFGSLPDDFNTYVDVFFAKRGDEDATPGDQINAVGNHLGSYLLQYELSQPFGSFIFYHEHPFEDGSGTRLANFPDGVWGISYAPNNKKVFSRIVYEFITTKDQSGSGTGTGFDRYFSNRLYRTGWAYEQTIIGFPFMTFDPTRTLEGLNTPIINDVIQLHHIGVNGSFGKFAWMLKSSYSRNFGTLREPFPETLSNWYNVLTVSYDAEAYGIITLITGADTSNLADDNFGAGLQYSYKF